MSQGLHPVVPEAAPPWGDISQWREANAALADLIERKASRLERAYREAGYIEGLLRDTAPLMDRLGHRTCRSCAEPCSLPVTAWFDFRDLLFLQLSKGPVPLAQMLPGLEAVCRYLTETGCSLPRLARPWICTWYLCPGQTELLRRELPRDSLRISRAWEEIKAARKRMERAFIETVTA